MPPDRHISVEAVQAGKDHLWPQISSLPYFRGLLRAVEARFYENIDLPQPVLDLGCGDGHFASRAFENRLEVGLDPWRNPLREALASGSYRHLLQAEGHAIPFEEGYFSSAVSNSVLEHIPDLDPVLQELARVMKRGGVFVFCVPNHNFLGALSISGFFDRIGMKPLGNCYRAFFNRIARHHHCDPPQVWQARLERAGFVLVDWWHYFSPRALRVLEWGHYLGLPSLIVKKITSRWILVPHRWNLALTELITRRVYNEPSIQEGGTCTFYIARRV